METKGEVLTREFLLEKIWGSGKDAGIDSRTINVHIHRLRQKLGSEGDYILTVKNVGYRFQVFFNWIKFGA
jgi:DNA-binding response OmpR family regulator